MDGERPLWETRLVITERQLQVLQLAARGIPHKNIALQMGMAEHTVANHLYMLRKRLGVPTTARALVLCYKAGLIK